LANILLESKVKRRKVFFAIIASIIIIVLIAGTVVALTFMSNPTDNPQATETPNQTPTASPQPTTPTTSTITINQPDTLPQGYISASQALEIAKPYYLNYTQKYNRTITEIKITYFDSKIISDWGWEEYSGNYSGWAVEAFFHMDQLIIPPWPATPPPTNDPKAANYWDISYYVVLRADNGQIVTHNPKLES
jgi:flagellar basal body-associated protein FliL